MPVGCCASTRIRPRPPADDRAAERAGAREEEAPPVPVGHRDPGAGPGGAPPWRPRPVGAATPPGREPDEPAERHESDAAARAAFATARTGMASGSRRAATSPTTPNPTNTAAPHRQRRAASDPATSGDRERDEHDEDVEGQLVVRAEQADEHVLRAGRLQADDERADRDHERRRAPDDAGEQLRRGDREAGRERAGQCGRPRPGHGAPEPRGRSGPGRHRSGASCVPSASDRSRAM